MATLTHNPSESPVPRRWPAGWLARDVWVSLAITAIWIVVLLDALFGPDIVVNNASGFTRVPSAVIVVVFAYLATRVVAKWGFGSADEKTATPARTS
ncbi:MAG TPA: hypothetical protein VFM58_01980 [Solirubrobacteraceae bacterium]|nr:hypothetical protein [Solirubrobacteraceae bacterium]